MRNGLSLSAGALALMLACTLTVRADDKLEYNRRAAARFVHLFHTLDLDRDGTVTRDEARGDVNFLPRFNDMEVDMNGVITLAELHRYLEQQFGTRP